MFVKDNSYQHKQDTIDERVEDEGSEMNYKRHKQAGSKFQGVSPVER